MASQDAFFDDGYPSDDSNGVLLSWPFQVEIRYPVADRAPKVSVLEGKSAILDVGGAASATVGVGICKADRAEP
jgi:hypothetical protein